MHVACREPGGAPSPLVGVVSDNIGAGGFLFKTARWREFPVGAKVDYTVFLPPELSGVGWHPSRLSGAGRVTRHEALTSLVESEWRAVAVSLDRPMTLD